MLVPNETVVVIGGGPAGLQAARSVADLGARAVLVEKQGFLGGTPIAQRYAALTPDLRDAETAMREMIDAVERHPLVEVRLNSEVTACEGTAGDFRLKVSGPDGKEEVVPAGAVIVATGFDHFDPGRERQVFSYYELEDVITLVDAEAMFKEGKIVRPSDGRVPERVCFIQCVGSRDRGIGNQWCSKVCCGIACKQAIEIKKLSPSTKVFVFYIDLRAFGFWEDELYWKAQEEYKVNFIRGVVTEVLKKGDRLLVKGEDTTMGRPVEIEMDLVILSVGMEPSEGTKAMAKVLGLPLESHGFIATKGGPLDTVSTPVEGIFVAGAASGPRDLEDSVSQGGLAAAKAVAMLRRGKVGARGADRAAG